MKTNKQTNKQTNHSLAWAVLLAIATAHTPSAQAAVVYDNGVVVPTSVFGSDVNFPEYRADNFTLTAGNTTFNTVSWTGLYASTNTPQATDVFTIQLYADSSGLPATTPFATFAVGNAVARTDTGATMFGSFNLYRYTASIDSTSLTAGQMYWLSVFNNTTVDTNDNWHWGAVSSGDGVAYRLNTSGAFTSSSNNNVDFTLSNNASVPEPATFALIGLGLAGLTFARKRRTV
jgi:hypothetical protein